jgi:hypothetical protein
MLGDGMKVIFSLRDGEVWLSFGDDRASLRVGKHNDVAAAMRDFLLQGAVASRLLREATDACSNSQAAG